MELTEIWRYPVKSMLGESLEQANIGPGGIEGDRRWAVVDAESGVSLSAKRYPDLLRCRAWTRDSEVMISLPDGGEYLVDSAEVASGLSDLLGRRVTTRSADATETIQHEFPTAVTKGEGEPFLYEPKTEAFFDCAPLQLLTSATLAKLQQRLPDSIVHRARFRPNFLIETSEIGFIENDWVNKNLTLGALRCQVYDDTRRCIMVALAQGDLPRDTNVIQMILKINEGRAGVALKTMDSGTVRCGAKVELLA
ncbi:MOSC N-terminal beta barrel domain-containing protein [Nodosilinea sp. LEGE 07088]|uniref:MOSC domain-containing protein n=1 Tax=Nodosilinea sp. LEGE 07088 TaxID=2777968 RepID=UPI00187F7C9A|nr:MOSC N-terminal beta barrel domain-containing protein [Nodosilinea sp. LEGE 07088]MBE9138499.1 MOSC N-terminal beta barrel domain-containing protein [Nodosilinea sp. LEGE 07088]